MTFPLDFDLLMIGVCTFIQGKKNKKQNKTKKQKQKQKQKNNKKKTKKKSKKQKKKKKKVQRYVCVSYLTPLIFFVVGFINGGLSEIFMRDELHESSLRSFVPWIMTDMYLI